MNTHINLSFYFSSTFQKDTIMFIFILIISLSHFNITYHLLSYFLTFFLLYVVGNAVLDYRKMSKEPHESSTCVAEACEECQKHFPWKVKRWIIWWQVRKFDAGAEQHKILVYEGEEEWRWTAWCINIYCVR